MARPAHNSSPAGREVGPTYTVPLLIMGLIVFFVTLFGVTFAILPSVIEDRPAVLQIVSVVAIMVVLLSWFGLLRAWATRRRLARCRLLLEGDGVSPETPCCFTIEDRGAFLNVATMPRFSLSYQDIFRRTGGRKVYEHGPYVIDAEVSSEFSAKMAYPSVRGEFTLKAGQIKIDPPDENWETRTVVILTMRLPGGRRCKFELPYTPSPATSERGGGSSSQRSVMECMLGLRRKP